MRKGSQVAARRGTYRRHRGVALQCAAVATRRRGWGEGGLGVYFVRLRAGALADRGQLCETLYVRRFCETARAMPVSRTPTSAPGVSRRVLGPRAHGRWSDGSH